MRYEVRSIGIWALIKVGFFLNLLIGFLFGIFASLIFIPMARVILAMAGAGEMPYDEGTSFGMLFIMPFLLAILGAFFNTLFMVLVAACYNLVARIVGGLELSFSSLPDDSLLQVAPVVAAVAGSVVSAHDESSVILPPPPPPFRPAPVVPMEESEPAPTSEAVSLPEELPVKIRQTDESEADQSPVVEPHTEPEEDWPRQDNP